MKRLIAMLGLGLCVIAGAAQAQAQEAEALVRQTTEQVLSALEQSKERIKDDPLAVQALVGDIVLTHFDFELMSRLVLARGNAGAAETVRQRIQAVADPHLWYLAVALLGSEGGVSAVAAGSRSETCYCAYPDSPSRRAAGAGNVSAAPDRLRLEGVRCCDRRRQPGAELPHFVCRRDPTAWAGRADRAYP